MKYTLLILLLSTFLFAAAGCKDSNKDVQTESSTEAVTTTATTATETTTTQQTTTTFTITTTVATANETITTTQQTTTATTVEITETAVGYTEREILEPVCIEMFGEIPPSSQYKDHVEYLIETAKTLTEKYSHSVADKDDLIEQARNIWIEILGSEYIEEIESEYIELDGELVKYERNVPPYTVEYYDEYDVWYINPNAPSGVTENGIKFGTPSMPPYLLIRGEDGKILGALF
ncbi:MAG: hypothetical protein IJN05_04965 [Ruminococcus sp.]|nr:hypothetical protein [Ruminococcus sp.]